MSVPRLEQHTDWGGASAEFTVTQIYELTIVHIADLAHDGAHAVARVELAAGQLCAREAGSWLTSLNWRRLVSPSGSASSSPHLLRLDRVLIPLRMLWAERDRIFSELGMPRWFAAVNGSDGGGT